jgi:hypothetical protein
VCISTACTDTDAVFSDEPRQTDIDNATNTLVDVGGMFIAHITPSHVCVSVCIQHGNVFKCMHFSCLVVSQRTRSCIVDSRCVYACLCLSVDQPDISLLPEPSAETTRAQHTHEDAQPTTATTATTAVAASAYVPPSIPSIGLDVDSIIS